MANIKKVMEEIAPVMGLSYDAKKNIAYGRYRGFTMLVEPWQLNSKQPQIAISFMASINGDPLNPTLLYDVKLPQGVSCTAAKYRICMLVPLNGKQKNVTGAIVDTARIVVDFVLSQGGVNSDENGMAVNTFVWRIKGQNVILGEDGASTVQSKMRMQAAEADMKQENYVLGIIGGLLGSLVGALVIFLIARIGFISVLGGIILGFAVVFGYKKLAGKFSLFGLISCIIITIVMTYAAFYFDAAASLYFALDGDFTFAECLQDARFFYELAGEMGTYYRNLALMMIMGAGGGIGAGIIEYNSQKEEREIYRLG